MAQSSSRPQPASSSSQYSPVFSGRHFQAAPSRTPQERDFPYQRDLSPLHHRSRLGEMGGIETPRATVEDRRDSMMFVGQSALLPRGPSNSDAAGRRGIQSMALTSIVCDDSSFGHSNQSDRPQAIFGDSQQYSDCATQQTDMAYRGNADLDWRSGPGEAMRNPHYTSSPIGRYAGMGPTHPRMSFCDEMVPGDGPDPAVGANGTRRLSVPPSVINANHDVSRFSASAAMYPYDGGDYPCRCTPEPPRPRNSFMLFRQHHQREVAKAHKGLSNPDISKIIGAMWRDAADDEREKWTLRAEEEKESHGAKYPGYRYKPNRRSKSQGKQNRRCSKCGGRLNATTRIQESPESPKSPVSPKSSRSSQASRTPRALRGPRGQQTPQISRASGFSTPSATSPAGSIATGHGFWESNRRTSLNISNAGVHRQTSISPPSLSRPVMPEPASRPTSDGFQLSPLPPLPSQQDTDSRRDSLFGNPPRLPAVEPPLPSTPLYAHLAGYKIHSGDDKP
ncbi:Repressor of filamentous growth 1 [Trichoderma ghanense]|uniref:Repressor of filamentous growth 1 n=1 Tax=Trichoderma ghanense TaxID=65468 RepID=A0ABY2HAH8_9HYPO